MPKAATPYHFWPRIGMELIIDTKSVSFTEAYLHSSMQSRFMLNYS